MLRILIFLVVASVSVSLGSGSSGRPVVEIYDSNTGPIRGWSHIVTHPERFPFVSLPTERYAVDESSMEADAAEDGGSVFRTVMVRKLSDWNQQHSNGLEPLFEEAPIPVESVEAVRIVLKLNSSDTRIPSSNELERHYGAFLSAEQIAELDASAPCLGLALLEAGYTDQSTETLNAVKYLIFDPVHDMDRWLDIEIPIEAFQFGLEKNYTLRPIDAASVGGREFIAFRINQESTGGIVARNFLNEDWDGSVPELAKELSVSLRLLEVVTKKEKR